MKKFLPIFFLITLSFKINAQTIYYNAVPPSGFYNGDSTLKETAYDIAGLLNKAMNVNTFVVDTFPLGTINTGIILKIDTNLLTSQRLQKCSAVSDGSTKTTFVASSANGVRFGVYGYLAELGFKFYSPDTIWHIIPSLTSPYKAMNKYYETPLEYHTWWGQGASGPTALDPTGEIINKAWNLYQQRNNMINEHGLQGHIGEGWVADFKTFLLANPCYIAEHKGAHDLTGAVPDIHNPLAMQHWADFAASLYSSQVVTKNPWERSRITVEVTDGTKWGNTATSCGVSSWPSASEQNILLANYTTNSLKSTFSFPFKTTMFAYAAHYDTTALVVDSSIQVGVTFGWQNETTPTGLLHRWKTKHPKGVWEYDYMNLPDGTYQSPFTSMNYLKYQAKRIDNMQTLGVAYESTLSIFAAALYQDAFHKSLMDGSDVQTNFNTLITDLFPGSSSKISELFGLWTNDNHWSNSQWIWENKYRFPHYLSLINDAAGMSGGAAETKRIKMLKAYMHYLILLYDEKVTPTPTLADSIIRWNKVDKVLDYLASIYHTKIVNSFQEMNIVVSYDASPATFHKWIDTTGGSNSWKAAPFLAITPIDDAQIDIDFDADTTLFPVLANYRFVEPDSILKEACKQNLVAQDTINFFLNALSEGGTSYQVSAPSAGTIRIIYKKKTTDINKKINFVIDSEDQLYSVTATGDTTTQNGIVDLVIPAAGNYQFAIMYPNIAKADISIVTNGNFLYHNKPIYSNGIQKFTDTLSSPRYIYVPKGINKLYFSVQESNADSAMVSTLYRFKNAQGNKPKINIESTNSNLYYFIVDLANAGKFWQLYVDTLVYSGNFSLVNTQNIELYLEPGVCNTSIIENVAKIDFQIFPNPSSGLFSLKMKTEGLVNVNVFNITGQNTYTKQYPKWNGMETLDLSSLSPGIYLVKIENKGVFSTKKIIISK